MFLIFIKLLLLVECFYLLYNNVLLLMKLLRRFLQRREIETRRFKLTGFAVELFLDSKDNIIC